jgi:hypothetical protein
MNDSEEPLIYTIKGNLPISMLKYSTHWEETPDYVKFVETYTLDGETVKQSAHVLTRPPLPVGATINPL